MFDQPFLGLVIPFAGIAPPEAWMFCQGQELPIRYNEDLFSLIGNTFGGDGIKTFALPNLCGRVVVHAGQAPQMQQYTAGETGGHETVWITVDNLPIHTHPVTQEIVVTIPCTDAVGTVRSPENHFPANISGVTKAYSTAPGETIRMGSTNYTVPTRPSPDVTGEIKEPVYIMSPFLTMNYIICIDGEHPPHG